MNPLTKAFAKLYWSGNHQELLLFFREQILFFSTQDYPRDPTPLVNRANDFLQHFFFYFSQENLILREKSQVKSLLKLNHLLADMTAFSAFQTTDFVIRQLLQQPASLSRQAKILTLYSPRNQIKLDYRKLFAIHPELTSIWYSEYLNCAGMRITDPDTFQNLLYHYQYETGEKFSLQGDFNNIAFWPTYLQPGLDRAVKQRLYAQLSRTITLTKPEPASHKGRVKIAVISPHWHSSYSVYKTQVDFIRALRNAYHLTLITPRKVMQGIKQIDRGMFDQILETPELNSAGVQRLLDEKFSLIYYPAIGLDRASLYLSNHTIAPMQIAGLGHPVSTFGAKIHVFLSGADVENRSKLAENYTEHVLLLPGFGLNFEPIDTLPPINDADSEAVVNVSCIWHPQKISPEMMQVLRTLIASKQGKIKIRILTCVIASYLRHYLLKDHIEGVLGAEHVEVLPRLEYGQYLRELNKADICLESYPFGLSYGMTEYLHLGKPIVAFEGNQYYNRIGSAMLRRVGLEELVTTNSEEYIALTIRLIEDSGYRNEIRDRVLAADKSLIHRDNGAESFKSAIDYLLTQTSGFSLGQPQKLLEVDAKGHCRQQVLG